VAAWLASDMSSSEYSRLLSVWVNMHDYAGMPVNIESLGNEVSVLPVGEVETLIESAGFDAPVLFFKHYWFMPGFLK